ncbi:MAG: arylsulfatase [Chloroflexota bacterium]|nr:arylsulfatase [Chloroflexota bacterium]
MTNIVLIVADDMGYSDLGCYGGEIHTPNLDALGRGGARLSHFYNTARCSPSRASLLTGLHPHQTGVGVLTNDDRPAGYPGSLDDGYPTVAEILGRAQYRTCLSGKWHLASDMRTPNSAWPTRRGFEDFFGTLTGCGSYFHPGTLMRGEANVEREAADAPHFYYTDAITDHAVQFVARTTHPFFLYVAYTAPHWPLHARAEDIDRYRGVYDPGWDVLRERRMDRMRAEGILDPLTRLSPRDPSQPAWRAATEPVWLARRMEAYAAQIDRLDQGVGRIVRALEEQHVLDDTLLLFLSDNGASDEDLPKVSPERFRARSDIVRLHTRDGRMVRIGNHPSIVPGAEDTYSSYGRAWANLSNTPFRFYKRWVHEGGIASPFIAHWPAGRLHGIVHTPFQLVDVLPTILEATAIETGTTLEGRSMLPALRGSELEPATQYWEHTGNAALRRERWKLVREFPRDWELYDMSRDRTELDDRAAAEPALVRDLERAWQGWADRVGVIPWQKTLELYRARGLTDEEAAG